MSVLTMLLSRAGARPLLLCFSVVALACSSEGGGVSSSAPAIKAEPKTSGATAPSATVEASSPATASAPEPTPSATASARPSSRPGSVAPRPPADGGGRLGCPCGCDRSSEMAVELESEAELGHGDAAKATLLETLTTIAQREDGGYITEAMAQHRERMLSLAPSLFGAPLPGRGVEWKPHVRGLGAPATNGSVRVRVILSAHGEATEIVRGKEKPLRSSFRLGMEIQNVTSDAVTVAAPALDGSVSMPIDRVYVLGSSGAKWQGRVEAHETIYVNAIGYLGEPVQPGTTIEATVTFEHMALRATARAAGHWTECLPGATTQDAR